MTDKAPRILYVSRSVPPGASGSAVIAGNLAKQFTPREMVVVGAWFLQSPPVKWEGRWPKIIYASLHPPEHWRGGRVIRWAQFPYILLRILLAALRCDVILATYPDEIYLMAAYFAAVLTGKPLYLYFHNTYLEHDRGNLFPAWLQPRVFARARHVFVMSKGMQALYRRYYPQLSCSPLVHSFNEDLPEASQFDPAAPRNTPLMIALSGSVNASNDGAVAHMAQALKAMPQVRMTIYSKTGARYLEKLGVQGEQFRLTTVSRDVLLAELGKADIVFLPHGFGERETIEEVQTIFPTRTIEYLICGQPILAHAPADCFLADFLREHDCALLVTEPDAAALQQAVTRLQNDAALREKLVHNALKAAQQFHAPQVAARLREVLQTSDVQLAPELTS